MACPRSVGEWWWHCRDWNSGLWTPEPKLSLPPSTGQVRRPLSWNGPNVYTICDAWPHLTPLADPSLLAAMLGPLSHWPLPPAQMPRSPIGCRLCCHIVLCTLLPCSSCFVDLFVGITWLQMPDAQNKSSQLFELIRLLTSVNGLGYLFSLPFHFFRIKA